MLTIRKTYTGFSTPEVLLSIFVVSIGMVTIMTVMSSALRYSLGNQDIIIATDLAQEGIELVRNVRDNDFASGVQALLYSPIIVTVESIGTMPVPLLIVRRSKVWFPATI